MISKEPPPKGIPVRVDLHNHTWYSKDGMMSPEKLIALARKKGLNAIAITDHNRLTVFKSKDMIVVPGEEVKTAKGEIIGLFLNEEIPKGLPPEVVFDRIREQGGIIVIPHPFDRFRRKTALLLHDVKPPKDVLIEVLNARYITIRFYKEAMEFSRGRFPIVAGSDAHTPIEVGRAWTEVPEFSDEEELFRHLKKGRTRPAGRLSPPWVHATVPEIKLLHYLRVIPHK